MWVTALILGLAGSLHCAGMCSPLAFAVTRSSSAVMRNRLMYNTGRILTYAVMGAIFSGAGTFLSIGKYQHILSLTIGVALLIIGVAGIRGIRTPVISAGARWLAVFLKQTFASLLQRRHKAGVMLMGALNGLLPCGLTLLALGYCIILKGPWDGFNFMLVFGAGTLPAMFGASFALDVAVKKMKVSFQRVNRGLIVLSGLLLIARVLIAAGDQAHVHGQNMMDVVLCR